MNCKRKKSLRIFLLKESLISGGYKSKKNLFKKSQKITPCSTLEFSNNKTNKEESLDLTNKNKHLTISNNKRNKDTLIYKGRYENSKGAHIPKINYLITRNNNENKAYNSIEFYNNLSQLKRIKNKKRDLFSIKKSIFNSSDFDKTRASKKINPKFIRLSSVFEKNFNNDLISINTIKPCIKEKSFNNRIEIDKKYNDYINNRLKKNYNKNFDSSYVHKLNSDFMIEIIEKKSRNILNIYKKYLNNKKIGEPKLEEKDEVDDKNLGKIKLFTRIRNYLINQNKEDVIGKDTRIFYENKENRINFLDDINLIPHFKNNLVNSTLDIDKLANINYIEHNTLRNLNISRINIQKHKDYKNTKEYEKEMIEQKKMEGLDIEFDKNYTEKYDLYDMEDYLTKKKINQSEVKIFNDKNKILFYNTFMKLHDKIELKKNN